MADLRNINQSLAKLSGRVDEAIAAATADLAANILVKVAEQTPVDTSRAQSNWQLSDNKGSARYFYGAPDIDPGYGNRRGPAWHKVSRDAKNEAKRLSQGRRLLSGKKIRTLYIINPTPYLRSLDEGRSQQVRAGFIKRASKKEFNRYKRDFDKIVGDTLRRRRQ